MHTVCKGLLPGLLVCIFGIVQPVPAQSIIAEIDVSSVQPVQGDQIEVEVLVDLSGTSDKLGAYEARLGWDSEALALAALLDGETPALLDPQTRMSPGELLFSQFSVRGAGGEVSLLKVSFQVIGSPGQTTALDLSFHVLDAAQTFSNLIPQLQVQPAGIRVASAGSLITARVEVSSPQPEPGDQIVAEVLIDPSDVSGKLGAFEAHLNWDAQVLELEQVLDGETPEFLDPQTRTGPGELVFSQFNTRGAGAEASLIKVRFNVIGASGQTTPLDLSFAVLDAAQTFANLLPHLRVRPSTISIVDTGQDRPITAWLGLPAEKPSQGGQVEVEVLVDLSSIAEKLGAYEAQLSWDAQVLELAAVLDGETAAFAGPQTRVSDGELVFSHFNVPGASGRISLLKVRYDVVGGSGEEHSFDLSFPVLDAAQTFANLLPHLRVRPSTISIVDTGQDRPITAWLGLPAEKPSQGGQVEVEVLVDLSSIAEKLGAYEAQLSWDAQVLELAAVLDGETAAFAGPQTRVSDGELVFSHFNVPGASGRISLLKVRYDVVGGSGEEHSFDLSFPVLDAAQTFVNLLPQLQVQPATVTIEPGAPTTLPGDFDGDGIVGFSDFFEFADVFGLSVSQADPIFDLDGDGTIGFLDFFMFAENFGKEARAKLIALAQEYIGLPAMFRLEQNYPNPFNNSTTIRYHITEPSPVRLEIYDLAGQKIKTLLDGHRETGSYEVTWDATDDEDWTVSNGLYIVWLQAGERAEVKKMMFMK